MAGFSNIDLKTVAQYSFLPGGVANIGFAGTVLVPGTPTVTLVTPPTGPTTAATPVVVDVTDSAPLRRVIIAARFATLGAEEVVHQGNRFAVAYSSSTRTAITNGWRYTLLRNGGWPADVTVDFYAIDTTGTEA